MRLILLFLAATAPLSADSPAVLRATGEAVPVTEGVGPLSTPGSTLTVSQTGVLAFRNSSTSEFQAPQSAQRPSHFGDCAPHSWQTKTVLGDLVIW